MDTELEQVEFELDCAVMEKSEEVVNEDEDPHNLRKRERSKELIDKFLEWSQTITDYETFYDKFVETFSSEFRIELFDAVRSSWLHEDCVTPDVVFYWKVIVYNFILSHRKFQVYAKEYDLFIDFESKTTNLRLVKQKSTFRCFITKEDKDDNNDEPVCYFKENGFSYYVS